MGYELALSEKAQKDLAGIDGRDVRLILRWLKKNVADCDDPRAHGKALKGELRDYWRYRVGDYRILCIIDDGQLVVIAVTIGNRRNVYDRS